MRLDGGVWMRMGGWRGWVMGEWANESERKKREKKEEMNAKRVRRIG